MLDAPISLLVKDLNYNSIGETPPNRKIILKLPKTQGRYFCTLYFNQNPIIAIGPHWPLFLFAYSVFWFITVFMLINADKGYSEVYTLIISFIQLSSFLACALANPGLANKQVIEIQQDIQTYPKRPQKDREWLRFCTKCLIVQPAKTGHCEFCNICIYEYDHHCPWTGKCIGKGNIVYFYLFVLSTIFYLEQQTRLQLEINILETIDILQNSQKINNMNNQPFNYWKYKVSQQKTEGQFFQYITKMYKSDQQMEIEEAKFVVTSGGKKEEFIKGDDAKVLEPVETHFIKKENFICNYKALIIFMVRQFAFDVIQLNNYRNHFSENKQNNMKAQIDLYSKMLFRICHKQLQLSTEDEIFQYFIEESANSTRLVKYSKMILENYLDFQEEEVQEAFGREFSIKKPYFDPEFNGLIFLEINKKTVELSFCWKVFKDKIYLKVLISGIRKLVRLIILLEAIFNLMMKNSQRKVMIKTDFTLSYNKNQLERELIENQIFQLDNNNIVTIQFNKINYVKSEPGMK